MATATLVAPRTRDPFAGIWLPYHDRLRLIAHYEDAEPHVDPSELTTWKYEAVYQLATRGESFARDLARRGCIRAAARWQKTAEVAQEELSRRKEG